MAKCPICGKEVGKPSKEWDLGKIRVKQYECCGKKFREYEKKVEDSRSSVEKRVVSHPRMGFLE